jgi:hypothetical protein
MAATCAARIDHLVIAAHSLDQGVQWCESTLGVAPGPGGRHTFMGTHNRLLRISSDVYPRAYFEIIAVDPTAPTPERKRWFDLDDEVLQWQIRLGPRLVHFVASTADAASALAALRQLGIERGSLLHAQRPRADGMLSWRISVRADGQRLFYGGLPTLIEWDAAHPADSMPACGVTLQSLHVSHPRATDLSAAHTAIGLHGVSLSQGAPNLLATLASPRGVVVLKSQGA